MKKSTLAGLVCLLMVLTFVNTHEVAADDTDEENPWVTPALPEEVCNILPVNETDGDYLNATNPYSQGDALSQVAAAEGDDPIYALVFADDEERSTAHQVPNGHFIPWDWYAEVQLERGDDSLVANYGIDLRILGFVEWDSDDSLTTMQDLFSELKAETRSYLGQWYDGADWSGYVDVAIGITNQATTDEPSGLASGGGNVDKGDIFVLLKWQTYWADDNLVQHELGHLYYLPDHPSDPYGVHCAMSYQKHFQTVIGEAGSLWVVFADIPCLYTCYEYDQTCSDLLSTFKRMYEDHEYMLIIRPNTPYQPRGTTDPPMGVYIYESPTLVAISIASTNPGCAFVDWTISYWGLHSSYTLTGERIGISLEDKRTAEANFKQSGSGDPGGPSCPFVSVWDGGDFTLDNNVLPWSELSNGADVEDYYRLEQRLVPKNRKYSLILSEFENEHSYFDQAMLLGIDHSLDVNVAFNPTGKILTYRNPVAPASAVDNNGTTRLNEISLMDGNVSDPATYFQGYPGDCLILDFGQVNSDDAKLIVRDDQKKADECILVQVKDSNEIWQTVETLVPRAYWSVEAINLSPYVVQGQDLWVRLYWKYRHRLDFVGLDTTPQDSYEIRYGNLVSATHSAQGDVKSLLLYSDNLYAELAPGQQIQLEFTLPNNLRETRTLVFYTKGHYYTI